MMNQISIDETQRKVNRLMGMSDEEVLNEINGKRSLKESEDISEDLLQVAKMMGVDIEDIKKSMATNSLFPNQRRKPSD